MSIISLLIPIALTLASSFVGLFIYMSRSGQFDDLETPPIRALIDLKEKKTERNSTP